MMRNLHRKNEIGSTRLRTVDNVLNENEHENWQFDNKKAPKRIEKQQKVFENWQKPHLNFDNRTRDNKNAAYSNLRAFSLSSIYPQQEGQYSSPRMYSKFHESAPHHSGKQSNSKGKRNRMQFAPRFPLPPTFVRGPQTFCKNDEENRKEKKATEEKVFLKSTSFSSQPKENEKNFIDVIKERQTHRRSVEESVTGHRCNISKPTFGGGQPHGLSLDAVTPVSKARTANVSNKSKNLLSSENKCLLTSYQKGNGNPSIPIDDNFVPEFSTIPRTLTKTLPNAQSEPMKRLEKISVTFSSLASERSIYQVSQGPAKLERRSDIDFCARSANVQKVGIGIEKAPTICEGAYCVRTPGPLKPSNDENTENRAFGVVNPSIGKKIEEKNVFRAATRSLDVLNENELKKWVLPSTDSAHMNDIVEQCLSTMDTFLLIDDHLESFHEALMRSRRDDHNFEQCIENPGKESEYVGNWFWSKLINATVLDEHTRCDNAGGGGLFKN